MASNGQAETGAKTKRSERAVAFKNQMAVYVRRCGLLEGGVSREQSQPAEGGSVDQTGGWVEERLSKKEGAAKPPNW